MTATVISNRPVLKDGTLFDMLVYAPGSAEQTKPGQFAHIKCGGENLLRRPISIADAGDSVLRFCYDIRGKGTKRLSEAGEGDAVDLLCPLGKGFSCDKYRRVLLVGGGIGIYPLLFAASYYKENAVALFGFRNSALINTVEDFELKGTPVSVITDNGSNGRKGFVTDLLRQELEKGGYDAVFTCGPAPMMKNVGALAEQYGVPCQVSLEERMACGLGACLGCAVKIKTGSGEVYRRVCYDGPVFDFSEVIWQ